MNAEGSSAYHPPCLFNASIPRGKEGRHIMIITTTIADLFWIAHFPGPAIKGFIFYFHKNFLPEKTLKHLQLLPIFQNDGRALYLLDQQQNSQIAGIFEKLMQEKNSDYIFSKDLTRTYLIELIHCIVKIHQKKTNTWLADC